MGQSRAQGSPYYGSNKQAPFNKSNKFEVVSETWCQKGVNVFSFATTLDTDKCRWAIQHIRLKKLKPIQFKVSGTDDWTRHHCLIHHGWCLHAPHIVHLFSPGAMDVTQAMVRRNRLHVSIGGGAAVHQSLLQHLHRDEWLRGKGIIALICGWDMQEPQLVCVFTHSSSENHLCN